MLKSRKVLLKTETVLKNLRKKFAWIELFGKRNKTNFAKTNYRGFVNNNNNKICKHLSPEN